MNHLAAGTYRKGQDTPPEEIKLASSDEVGCTLADYAKAKGLTVEFLRGVGLRDVTYMGRSAVRIPYPDENGQETAVRFRVSLDGAEKFKWRSGDKPRLYGLALLNKAREAGYAVLVEGESDCQTLWHHEVPALGIPGAYNWKDEWVSALEKVERVYAVVEPDQGGETFWERLASSDLNNRLYRVKLDGAKDVSELYLNDPATFITKLDSALQQAVAYTNIVQSKVHERAREAWPQCQHLAHESNILERFAEELKRAGVAGETRVAKLLYLAMTSRFLDRPVSVALKGPSSGGKSYLTERVLGYFPERAYYALTAMSERALAYSEEPIKNRFLVLYEAAGMSSDFQTYLIRSLLSEGRLRYEVVEKTTEGLKPRLIEREGPTGLIVTTTAVKLHPENETRLLSLHVADTQEQTGHILMSLAKEAIEEPNLAPWVALQEWLEGAQLRATIPFAETLASMIPPVAVRLRRDFGAVLNLIRAHAVLHQVTRERDVQDCVIANLEDYAVVRELVVDLISESVEAAVQPIVRETVEAVGQLLEEHKTEYVTNKALERKLKLGKGPVSRRVRLAIDAGYLRNLEDRKGKATRLVLGEGMPEDLQILPTVEEMEVECFTVSSLSEKIDQPPPAKADPGVDF